MSDDCPLIPVYDYDFMEDSSILNTYKSARRVLKMNTFKINSKAYITIREALNVNDIFINIRDNSMKYYVKKFFRFTQMGLRQFEIARVDGNLFTQVDIDRLKIKTTILIKGKFQNKCKTCVL